MNRPPEPNKPLLKSSEHLRELEEQIAAWKQLTEYIAEHVVAPLPRTGMKGLADYQRDIAYWIRSALADRLGEPEDGIDEALSPQAALEFLQAHWPDPPYEVIP